MAGISIYALKENVMALHTEVESLSGWLAENASNPKTPMDEIKKTQAKLAEVSERHKIAAEQLKLAEDGQRAQLAAQEKANPTDPKASDVKLKAAFLRAAVTGDKGQARAIAAKLGAIPAGDSDLGGGENFLPKNIATELIAEPMDDNPIRRIAPVTNITGLVLPRIAYTIDDDDFVTDEDVASEMALSGDNVTFGRFKSKVIAKISDTVLYGTDSDLVSYVQNALQSGLATKEKKCLFNASPISAEAHMSFYAAANAIKRIEGATLYDAIVAAMGDLNDAFAANATVIMTRAQYLAMVRELANDNATLWGSKPEDIIVKENQVKAYAWKKGIVENGKELTEQEKVLARYGLIMEQSQQAQGRWNEESDQTSGKLKTNAERLDEINIKLGQALIPAMDTILSVIEPITQWLANLNERGAKAVIWIAGAMAVLGPLIRLLSVIQQFQMAAKIGGVLSAGTALTNFFGGPFMTTMGKVVMIAIALAAAIALVAAMIALANGNAAKYQQAMNDANKVSARVSGAQASARKVTQNARGSSYFKGGGTWVGEEGPEYVDLPQGSRIHPAGESRRAAGGGDTFNLQVTLDRVRDVLRLTDTAENARRLARQNG